MVWCCRSDGTAQTKEGGNGAAPKGQSMKDRAGPMDDDERAVDWWRNRQKSQDEGDENTAKNPQQNSKTFQGSQTRMQERNPLAKPYDIGSREVPLRPKDGNILQPPGGKEMRQSPSSSKMEVFQPKLPPPLNNSLDRLQPSGKYDNRTTTVAERITVIASVEDGDDGPMHQLQTKHDPPTPLKDPAAKYFHMNSLKRPDNRTTVKTKATKSVLPRHPPPEDDEDHLSDVPSDVDSVTKERYLLACQMLKTQLIAKEKTLVPIEREFILSLLSGANNINDQDFDVESVISEDQVSTIERAALRLDNDPLFQQIDVPGDGSDVVPSSPLTAASLQMQQQETHHRNSNQQSLKVAQHSTRATPDLRKPKKGFLSKGPRMSNPCNTRNIEDLGPADIVLIVRDEDEDDEEYRANVKSGGVDEGRLVRFDGWSNHKSAEYPFLILGADDPRLRPRVMTPSIMEALRGFFPFQFSESNFWLKFSLIRDGASLATLLSTVRASAYTIIGIETNHGEVFGCCTGAPWRTGTKWFGTGEAFLWRLKKSRMTSPYNSKQANFENEMEVYPYTGYDDLVQYCTSKTIAIGGGDWLDTPCPFQNEPRGIGLMIDGDLAGGETNSCATFANPRLCQKVSASNEFSIVNLEVWTMTPCLTVKEASKLEMKKLFVEENTR